MSLFDEKREKEILASGGALEGDFSEKEIEQASSLVGELIRKEIDGFFIVVKSSKHDEDHTKAEGMMKIHNFDKMRIIEVVMRSLGVSKDDIRRYLLVNSIIED